MKKFLQSTLVLLIFTVLAGCDDSLDSVLDAADVEVEVNTSGLPDGSTDNAVYTFYNVSTGRSTETRTPQASLLPGLYDVTYEATLHGTDGITYRVRAFRQSVVVNKGSNHISITAYHITQTDDLIIAEVFFSGTLQPTGTSYIGDDYVVLYNNTDHVVYADGLTLFESKFNTTDKYDYTPDIMSEAVTVQALYTIPGRGTEHPVKPGEYLVLANTAIDHRSANPNSFDLSGADFEWYDESSSPSFIDIDAPGVPNLDKWYCYTRTVWMLHNRGFKAFGIARIPIEKEQYLRDYFYDYEYELVIAAGSFAMSGQAYRLPNEWVVDVVNCSVASDYAWNVTAPTLDSGWSSCGTIDADKNRFFKSVRRKMLYLSPEGRPVYKDTNNSTVDFNASATPSLIEQQGTAIDFMGTPCTSHTYDGITPIEK